ncbi:MAG: hypothetical protein KF809_15295 [Chloroflexi bacterium]|nr:hypothetical protein [Chloroflexota bacterium]
MQTARCPSVARPRSLPAVSGGVAVVLALLLLGAAPPTPAAAAGTTYHVSCSGDDSATGRGSARAWRTLGRASKATLRPGDTLRLQRGCSFTGPLKVAWAGTSSQPIVIRAYGSGSAPIIRNGPSQVEVSGRHLVIRDLAFRASPVRRDAGCEDQPLGNRYGVRVRPGAHHVRIRGSHFRDLQLGVWVESGAHHVRVLRNEFVDVDFLHEDATNGAGAVAIAIHGDHSEIAWNRIRGSDACSRPYGRDGAAIDIYGGRGTTIHHNIALDNHAFLELGTDQNDGSLARDTLVAYNEVRSRLPIANYLVVRGGGRYGPNPNTVIRHDSVYLSGAESYAIQCTPGCTSGILTMRDTIIWARDRVGFIDGSWAESRNIFWSPTRPNLWFPIASTSVHGDPRFVDAAAGDLRLRANSPGVDRGGAPPTLPGGAVDLAGRKVPQGARPDIGAWERPR